MRTRKAKLFFSSFAPHGGSAKNSTANGKNLAAGEYRSLQLFCRFIIRWEISAVNGCNPEGMRSDYQVNLIPQRLPLLTKTDRTFYARPSSEPSREKQGKLPESETLADRGSSCIPA